MWKAVILLTGTNTAARACGNQLNHLECTQLYPARYARHRTQNSPPHQFVATISHLKSLPLLYAFKACRIGPSKLSGFVVLAHRFRTCPSFPIKNFSKFHLILFIPISPGFSFFIHSYIGSALSPLTSILPRTGNVTP